MSDTLKQVFVTNGIALLLVLITSISSIFLLKEKNRNSRMIRSLLLIIFIGALIEPFTYLLDAHYGFVGSNKVLEALLQLFCIISRLAILCGLCSFEIFIVTHLTGSFDKKRFYILNGIVVFVTIMLIVNIFCPFIYRIKDGAYERINIGFYMFTGIAIIIFLDTIFSYFYIRRKGGMLKFFPIWLFVLPSTIGILIQIFIPDTSTVWLCTGLAVTAMVLCLQNEFIFRDRLTKLYNRVFLDLIKKIMDKKANGEKYTAMMLDLNGFKLINDNYGHLIGDEALIITGELLREAVGPYGVVIRYAGDEFVIIVNSQDDNIIQKITSRIDKVFDDFNKKELAQYKLSISLGVSKADLNNRKMDDIIQEVDEKMYVDKEKKHKQHPEWDRK